MKSYFLLNTRSFTIWILYWTNYFFNYGDWPDDVSFNMNCGDETIGRDIVNVHGGLKVQIKRWNFVTPVYISHPRKWIFWEWWTVHQAAESYENSGEQILPHILDVNIGTEFEFKFEFKFKICNFSPTHIVYVNISTGLKLESRLLLYCCHNHRSPCKLLLLLLLSLLLPQPVFALKIIIITIIIIVNYFYCCHNHCSPWKFSSVVMHFNWFHFHVWVWVLSALTVM